MTITKNKFPIMPMSPKNPLKALKISCLDIICPRCYTAFRFDWKKKECSNLDKTCHKCPNCSSHDFAIE